MIFRVRKDRGNSFKFRKETDEGMKDVSVKYVRGLTNVQIKVPRAWNRTMVNFLKEYLPDTNVTILKS